MALDDFTPEIDLTTGDVPLTDGELTSAPSVALGLVVWVLRTERGSCLVAPDIGVPWRSVRKNTDSAPAALREAILASLRWIEEGGYLSNLSVRVERTATNGLRYEVRFEAEGRSEIVPGQVP